MEIITKKIMCDCCGAEIEFLFSHNIFPDTSDKPIKITFRNAVTNHGEEWISADLCKDCADNFKALWDLRAGSKGGKN